MRSPSSSSVSGLAMCLSLCVLGLWQPALAEERDPAPIYAVTLVSHTTQAVNYTGLHGPARIDFRGTPLQGRADGKAVVRNHNGTINILAEVEDLGPATQFGPGFLTYVLWGITPEGRPTNLGELRLDEGESKIEVTTELRVFALIVTAEPYFAVTQPSDLVVLENVAREDAEVQLVNAKYELLDRKHYTLQVEPPLVGQPESSQDWLDLRQARRALVVAENAGADRYAAETYQRAAQLLADAEKERSKKQVKRLAREAVQTAEDARLIAAKRAGEEQLAQERQAAKDREARARAEAEGQANLRAAADSMRAAEVERRQAAEMDRDRSEQARAQAELDRAAADDARQTAEEGQQAAQLEADRARQLAEAAEKERAELRGRLQQQLNLILETRDTARGLVVNMSDVLFATGKYTLQPGAREKLAKIAGIVLAYPGLELEIEGHTDSVGSEDYNQRLSEQRASAVRDYLVQQSLPAATIQTHGYGESRPVASNDTAAERVQNRRVEIVVSGEPIGIVGIVEGISDNR